MDLQDTLEKRGRQERRDLRECLEHRGLLDTQGHEELRAVMESVVSKEEKARRVKMDSRVSRVIWV